MATDGGGVGVYVREGRGTGRRGGGEGAGGRATVAEPLRLPESSRLSSIGAGCFREVDTRPAGALTGRAASPSPSDADAGLCMSMI